MPDINIRSRPQSWQDIVRAMIYTVIFNTAIALLLIIMGFGTSFMQTFILSQCIGLTICSFATLVSQLFLKKKERVMRVVMIALAIVVGAVCGSFIGAAAAGLQVWKWSMMNQNIWRIIGVAMILGFMTAPFFYNRKKLAETLAMAQEEYVRRLSVEKLAVEADLKRLQAQIEPHFLFNTLSNILSLMDTDPAKAKSMQLDLIRYLRTSLGRTRNRETTLGQEIDLVRAYLDIFKIRMGQRLEYDINISEQLLSQPLPPMLLQPLVENAVIHGLESKIDGGKIALKATVNGDILRIDIADTGTGLGSHHKPGMGLTNVKKRLAQLYGDKGHLIIMENQPSGVIVRIEIPLSALPTD